MRAFFEDETRGLDGVAETLDAGDATGAKGGSIHEEGVELDAAIGGEKAASAGVEGWVVFEDGDGGLDGIDGGAAPAQDGIAGFKSAQDAALVIFGHFRRDGPGSSVD